MKHKCSTCKFTGVWAFGEPCRTCNIIWNGDDCIDNWQPAKPKRKDLQAQLDAANARVALEKASQQPSDVSDGGEFVKNVHWWPGARESYAKMKSDNERIDDPDNRENPRPDNRFTMPDIAFSPEELDALLADAKRYAEELEILKRYQGLGNEWNELHVYQNSTPGKPAPDANARLADLQARYDALLDCYFQHEEPDSDGGMMVDFGKVLVEHEQEVERLTKERDEARWQLAECEHSDAMIVANAEIESMHRELEAKEAEIDDVWEQLSARNDDIADLQQQLAEKDAIIEERNRELEEALAECTFLNEWSDIWEAMYNAEEKWAVKWLEERDEALAVCTELGRYT